MNNAAEATTSSNMHIRRFVAANSRAALRQVRDALGGDAIILANRSIDGGVEVLAAAPEAVDALTRRMTAGTHDALPLAGTDSPAASRKAAPATPTELGLKPAVSDGSGSTVGKKRLASFFGRRAASQDRSLPTMAEQTALQPVNPFAASKAATSYLSFADELTAAGTLTAVDDDVVSHLATQLGRAPAIEVRESIGSDATVAAAAAEPAPVATPAAPVVPSITAAELTDAVAREVRNEIGRELGRDMINDLTHDVSREVSLAVSDEVREVSSAVSRALSSTVTRELRTMQATITEHLATMTWTDAMRRQPARTKLMQDLILAGFSPALSRHIQSRLPDDFTSDQANVWAKNILKRNLPVAPDAEQLIDEGGVFALVGPTGVGKTTTVAKLAARFAMKHGVDQLALITTDGFRIGAQDQLRIYGKILGIPVHSIHDEASLNSTIAQLAHKKLVLIDTAGLGQRDERVTEQIAMLRGAKARRIVVLNATSDAETLDHVVATFADREFAGCVITKTDEAVRLGPVLDTIIRHRLRIHHVSTGQKVPEDLERPDPAQLIDTALARSASRAAFEVDAADESVWLSAMAGRASMLDASLLNAENVHA